MRSVVLIHGLLQGMGREEPCEMLAIKESRNETSAIVFSQCSVIDAPQDLPNGVYTVSFGGYIVPARKESGLWIPEEATTAAPMHEPPATTRPSFRIEEAAEILPLLKDHVA
jgi:hypothetical protein